MIHQDIYQLMKYKRDELNSRLSNIKQDFNTKSSEDDVLFTVAHQTKLELFDVKKVIYDIEHGSFGFCKICNTQIQHDQLQINPFENTCTNCKINN